MNSNVRIEGDMQGVPHGRNRKSESLAQRGQRRCREDDGMETHQQDENENEIEQIVDRNFAETNSDARSRSLWGAGGANRDHMTRTINQTARQLHIQVTIWKSTDAE